MATIKVIDFWAEWCGPCKMMAPIIKEIESEYAGRIEVSELNIDEDANRTQVEKYSVMSIPTYIILKDNEPAARFVGVQPKQTITDKLDELLK